MLQIVKQIRCTLLWTRRYQNLVSFASVVKSLDNSTANFLVNTGMFGFLSLNMRLKLCWFTPVAIIGVMLEQTKSQRRM